MSRWIARLLLVAALVVPAGCARTRTAPAPVASATEPVAKLTTDELIKQYQENELAADGKYKNQVVQVTGQVGKVGKHPLGYPFVQLGSAQEDDLFGVTCYLTEAGAQEAAKLQVGAKVTLKGTCAGKLGGAALRLNDCEFVKP
jgi:hypothetical protein